MRTRAKLAWGCVAVILAVIFYLTFQAPKDTAAISAWFQRLLLDFFGQDAPAWVRNLHELRSLAHTPLYFTLAGALFIALTLTVRRASLQISWEWISAPGGDRPGRISRPFPSSTLLVRRLRRVFFIALVSLAISSLVGLLDELLKIILPTRHFELGDVGLDFMASVVGSGVCAAVAAVRAVLRRH